MPRIIKTYTYWKSFGVKQRGTVPAKNPYKAAKQCVTSRPIEQVGKTPSGSVVFQVVGSPSMTIAIQEKLK